jgi:hypothetical protein
VHLSEGIGDLRREDGLIVDPVFQLLERKALQNGIYAFNGQQLYVFYSTAGIPGSVPNVLSTGAPFAISGSNMVVVPISVR